MVVVGLVAAPHVRRRASGGLEWPVVRATARDGPARRDPRVRDLAIDRPGNYSLRDSRMTDDERPAVRDHVDREHAGRTVATFSSETVDVDARADVMPPIV